MNISFAVHRYKDIYRSGFKRQYPQEYEDEILGELVATCGEKKLSKIKYGAVRGLDYDLWQKFKEQYGPNTFQSNIDNIRKVLLDFFTWASAEEAVCYTFKTVDVEGELGEGYITEPALPFTKDEIEKLYEACGKPGGESTTVFRDRAILLTLLDTGMFAGQLCYLQIRDVNLDHFQLNLPAGGYTSGGSTQISGNTAKALWRHMVERGSKEKEDRLFVNEMGNDLEEQDVFQLLSRLGEKAGVADVHPFRLRRTLAYEYVKNGGSLYNLQATLGYVTWDLLEILQLLRRTEESGAQEMKKASPVDNWQLK